MGIVFMHLAHSGRKGARLVRLTVLVSETAPTTVSRSRVWPRMHMATYPSRSKKVQRTVDREGITIKERYPTMADKYRQRNDGQSGPGPCKYNVSRAPGYGRPSYYMGGNRNADPLARVQEAQPGPGEYNNCSTTPGKNSPILRGTLYDITIRGRPKIKPQGHLGPGPAKYRVYGDFDKYTYGMLVDNVKGPPPEYWRDPEFLNSPLPGSTPLGGSASSASLGALKEAQHSSLTRVESSPL
eukprot:gnl/TRDRNA2_/TRDRNA2_173893_c0_seq1.p1 gnl/TRDRNA2_/TRDRNA2_173893_c0~~gnl/TRDRNA2_/TRDRNA2_173893_c0_seq1.p1  ORF type:complete len:241 (-),score=10.95 gnl/TRDRNA2_/TRDRNA2_173893_c0_seq1:152-874(-)